MITKILNELIPVGIVFLFAVIFTTQWVVRSMIDWQNNPDKSTYLGYSLGWYIGAPLVFVVGWYGTLALLIVGINIVTLIRSHL